MLAAVTRINLGSSARQTALRSFSSLSPLLAPKNKKDVEAKRSAEKKQERREALKKLQAKKPANTNPLFMPVADALRYLRASEVGRPVNEASISIQVPILKDRGVAAISGAVRLPKPLKETKILCLSNDESKVAQALENGAAQAGDVKLIDDIAEGKLNVEQFDKVLATPEIEPLLRKVSRILGPKGLMPSVKKGTIAEDLTNLIQSTLGTQPFRERNNYVSLTVGKCNFSDAEVLNNLLATSNAVKESIKNTKSKKPILVGQTVLSSTHGPGIVINF
ncbi:hypothetical protein CANINC_003923 [Pichia inconspicua]|uniref:Ribosomal protein n=1 Tax=Pichia inconspicua TaxID=52247 RepID=A0A4T0WYM5_9ASCO|nr:hypothetical protein CANINC_003923 [[Candida] inconspicua]